MGNTNLISDLTEFPLQWLDSIIYARGGPDLNHGKQTS
jgi:hypothetical protein